MPIKFEKLATQVGKNASEGRKTLVWTNFVGNFEAIGTLLAPYNPAKIHGAIPTSMPTPPAMLSPVMVS